MIELPSLYPQQETHRDAARTSLAKHRRSIINAPPGYGKTRLAKWILGASANRTPPDHHSGCSLFAVHRRGLVDNAVSSFNEEPQLPHGIIMSGSDTSWEHKVQVASIDSILSWFIDEGQYKTELTFDLIVFDETHSHLNKLKKFLAAHDPKREQLGLDPAYVIGLTATPKCDGLADVYKEIVKGPSTQWLIDNGFLSPFRYFRATEGQLDKLVLRGNEFTKKSVGEAMDGLSGALVRDWKRLAEERPTVGFFPRRTHAKAAMEELRAAGLRVEYVDGETSDDERRSCFRSLNDHDIDYLCNVQVVERGTDIPRIGCVQICTAVASVVRWRQLIGRGSRVHPEKKDCIAEGEPVLTDRGLVPIEQVRYSDRLWDGVNFVSHGGAICKGYQDVITYHGLTATPDHLVKTGKGWLTFRDCANQQIPIVQTGLGGAAIRERGNHLARHRMAWQDEVEGIPIREGSVRHLFSGVCNIAGQLDRRSHQGMPPLQSTAARSKMAVHSSECCERPVRQHKQSPLQGLWRAGDSVLLSESNSSCSLVPGESTPNSIWTTRPNQQRRQLRTWQPSVDNTKGQHEQPENPMHSEDAPFSAAAPGSPLRRCDADTPILAWHESNRDCEPISQPPFQETKRRVWDILNAGPRHRFTVSGLLVSNCIVLDHGGCLKRGLGFFEDDPHWSLDITEKDAGEVGPRPTVECPKCNAIYRGGLCKNCGYEPTPRERKGQGLEFDGAELKEVKRRKKKVTTQTPEQLMISALYMAGGSDRTWRQCVGIFKRLCEKQGTSHWVPRTVHIGQRRYDMIRSGAEDGFRRVSMLYPVTNGGEHGGAYLIPERETVGEPY